MKQIITALMFALCMLTPLLSFGQEGAVVLCQKINPIRGGQSAQRDNNNPTRVQRIVFVSAGSNCPKGFKARGTLLTDAALEQLRGPSGDAGAVGPQGPVGPQGAPGQNGAGGERGPAGPIGERGETGARGEAGERGQPGAKGERGDTGPRGEKGERGAQGPQGPTGPAGEPGRDGNGFTISSCYSDTIKVKVKNEAKVVGECKEGFFLQSHAALSEPGLISGDLLLFRDGAPYGVAAYSTQGPMCTRILQLQIVCCKLQDDR